MRFIEPRPFASPDVAARKLVEIANGVEAVQDGRIYIGQVNAPFLATGGSSGEDFRAGIERAIAQEAGYIRAAGRSIGSRRRTGSIRR